MDNRSDKYILIEVMYVKSGAYITSFFAYKAAILQFINK